MVPRAEIRGLGIDTPPGEVLRRAAAIGHAHIAVYRGSVEEPVGVAMLRDIAVKALEGPVELASVMRPPAFIPEHARVSRLLREFQRTRQHLAFVVDEYGIVQGLVSFEDVIEEIVGFRGHGAPEEPPFASRLDDGSYLIDGMAPAREARERLGLPLEDRPEYTTLAGFVLYTLGSVPKPGASFTAGGWTWTVVDMSGPRIEKVKVTPARAELPREEPSAG
jgi:putative hemolysin